jgi:REP element-mobilizing transposase RayT
MPRSWTQNYYHAVFSTKHREPSIETELEERLHPFLGGVARDLRCTPIAINGMADHVHVLVRYPSDLSHADLLRHLKGRSSRWIHETFPRLRSFAWQEGYGGFTLNTSILDATAEYIRTQKQHHGTMTYVQEVEAMLRNNNMDIDLAEVLE